eukprot:scaffold1215_cov99-Phaeocystis_antarctica.AAC.2
MQSNTASRSLDQALALSPARKRTCPRLPIQEDRSAFTQNCRASSLPRTATMRRLARPLARRRCSEPRSRSQPAGVHASAASSEGALRLRLASSVACASWLGPRVRAREKATKERSGSQSVRMRPAKITFRDRDRLCVCCARLCVFSVLFGGLLRDRE